MSGNDINILLEVMNRGFERVEGAIKDSRDERQHQVGDLHNKINKCNDHHAAIMSAYGERLAAVETIRDGDSHDDNGNKKFSIGRGKFKIALAGFKAADVVMILMAVAICIVIITQQRALNRLDAVEKSEHHNRIEKTVGEVQNGLSQVR